MRIKAILGVLTVVVGGALLLAPGASAAVTSAFDGAVDCIVEGDGDRVCGAEDNTTVETFDGSPIDAYFALPPEPASGPDGPYPLVAEFHGWGGSKVKSSQHWTDRGYAYFSISDRGWGSSCGGQDFKRLSPACLNGYNHLMDTRYEVRDAQELIGLLVDDGLVDPDAIGATGGSYGGGISMALAALKDRKMLPDGTLVPWESPEGTSISLAAAQPDIPWTDLAYSLLPSGRTLDYVEDSTYLPGKIGVMKQSFVTGLYGTGLATSNYAPPGGEPDINAWYALISAGDPYDPVPLAQEIASEVTAFHSSYYIDDSVAPAPLLISNGWTDDLFPADEAIRFYNRTRANHPGTDVSLFFSDHGHQRGQNKGADVATRRARRDAFFAFHLKGEGADPGSTVETLTQTCGGPSDGPFTAPTWKDIAPGEIRFTEAEAKLISPEAGDPAVGQAYDPITGAGACATADASDQPGLASYRLDPAPAGGFTLMGSPTVVADILNLGPSSQLAARLVDVDPSTGEQTLVARGLFRPADGTEATRQVFQLHPNGYRFAEGHVAKLELMPHDFPYGRRSNEQTPITVSNLELRLPVLESPGTAGAEAPAPKVVPPGSELAPDYVEPVDSDGDGIADGDDDCPSKPGPASNNGCPEPDPPDADGDGIPDASDACPADAGPAENNGCPITDADGDGIDDADDDCPGEPGPLSNNGCPVPPPDADGDGVPDAEDVCPDEAGPEENFGCPTDEEPDADDDGVPDAEDACPNDPGPIGNDGCPVAEPGPGHCEARIVGTDGSDELEGTRGSETLVGKRGGDRIKARPGNDCVRAGKGRDRINGGSGADVIRAGKGRDRIRSKDGTRDVVRCGPGRDRVKADRKDRLVKCEKRVR